MPYSSAQISGLVGGQMAMFSNQQQYSQQISGLYGTGPQQMAGGMQNPFPSAPAFGAAGAGDPGQLGAHVAQGMSSAVPGMMGAAALAGGFAGGAAGWLDPFTGTARGFMAGTGGAFSGLGGAITGGYSGAAVQGASSFGNLGRGLVGAARGGMGALGQMGARGALSGLAGGIAGGLATGGLYYAAGATLTEAAEQFGAGAQNVADVGMLAQQHMGPQYGQPGARAGGAMGRGQIREMVGVLEEMAGDDVMVTMDSLKRLMDQAGQSGLLQGIGSAQEFKQKFGGMVRQMKEIATVMGTTIEEAAPMFGQMRQMGLWSTTDVMGTAGAIKAAGPAAAPHMMATMQQGAQLSHAMGGRLGAGAAMGREAFLGIQAATRTGTLSPEMIREFTGGVGGVEGQRMVAQNMQGVMGRFSESAMGRLMMAGLGKFEGGSFTGGIDQEMMQRFMSGDIDVGELQRIGRKRTGTREAATSYMVRKGAIGQEMMAMGGMEGLTAAISQVAKRGAFGGGENVQNMLIQKIAGVDARQAEMIRNIGKDLPQIQNEKQRKLEATLDEQFRQVDERMNHSWQGFKDSLGQAFDKSWQPVRELGADVATSFGGGMDRAMDALYGRTKRFGLSSQQLQKQMWSAEGLGRGQGMPSLSLAARSGMSAETSLSERTRNLSRTGRGMFGLGAVMFGGGTNTEMLARMGAETVDVGPGGIMPEGFVGMEEGAAGGVGAGALIGGGLAALATGFNPFAMAGGALAGAAIQKNLGMVTGRVGVRASDRAEIIGGAVDRARDRTWKGLGFQGDKDSAENRSHLNNAKGAMRRLFVENPKLAADFAAYKKDNPEASMQTQWLMRELQKKDPQAAESMRYLAGSAEKGKSKNESMLDTFAMVLADADMEGPWTPDWDKDAARARGMQTFDTTEEYDKAISDTIEMAADMADSSTEWATGIGSAIGGALGLIFAPITGGVSIAAGAALGGVGFAALFGGQEEAQSYFEEIMQSDYGETFAKAMAGDQAAVKELGKNQMAQEKWNKLHDIAGSDPDKLKAIGKKLMGVSRQRFGKSRLKTMQRTSSMARQELEAGVTVGGETGETLTQLLQTYGTAGYGKGETGPQDKAQELAQQLIETGDIGALSRKGGAVGRSLAHLGKMRRQIGKMGTGDVSMEQLEAHMKDFGGIPEGMKEELRTMVESGSEFTGAEKERFQKMFTERASRGEVVSGGTMAGRRAGTDRMTELLINYTEASTKFVFAVGAAMQEVDIKDLQEKTSQLRRGVIASSNPAARPQ